MHLTIIKGGKTIDHRTLGIKLKQFRKASLSPNNQFETVEGRNGAISMGTSYDSRKISASFYIVAKDHLDFQLLCDEVYWIFETGEEMIVIDSRQPGKQWHVKVASEFQVEPISKNKGTFSVEFVAPFPYAESVGTTSNPFTFDAGIWQVAGGISGSDVQYSYKTASFSIYNGGDIAVDPRYVSLLITYTGASTNLSIKNSTTGDEWKYTGTTSTSDTLRLDGIRSTKNNLSIFRDTNRKLITLNKGTNNFSLTGASGTFTVSFDFRFYFV
ncbi:phage tail family protein [Fictibacillus enclensis]|uniref:phage tail family protein n=1 Tax=Fictibacillus enclensis TaxID=1017270 RepID=UPI0025A2E3D3|nr:phage tail family protein [Fictibacillus enclensis]MDM5199258.1 phage tail family protein [Fictibacillus enclensis]